MNFSEKDSDQKVYNSGQEAHVVSFLSLRSHLLCFSLHLMVFLVVTEARLKAHYS